MPARSAKQYGLMASTLGGDNTGVPKSVAQEFINATPAKKRSSFAKHLLKKKDKKK